MSTTTHRGNSMGRKSTIIVAAVVTAVTFSSLRPAFTEAQINPNDAASQIAQIDNTLAAWNTHLSNLYQYIQRDPTAWWYYANNPAYKAQYDAWAAYEWQRGQQSVQYLQAQRAYYDNVVRQSLSTSTPSGSTAPTASPDQATTGADTGTPGAGAAPTGSGAAPTGTRTRNCPPGSIGLLGVCSE